MAGRNGSFILSIDQGTSGTAASLYDSACHPVASVDIPVRSYFPRPGWVEQDPWELLTSIREAFQLLLEEENLHPGQIVSLGLANQGECLLLWDLETGDPVYNLIGWQCARSADLCRRIASEGHGDEFRRRSGLPLDPEWPATKVPWILGNIPRAAELLNEGRLAFSQSDSWFLYHLSKERSFRTDHSTASRSGFYNIERGDWDPELIQLFRAEGLAFPEIQDSSSAFGVADFGGGWQIPLTGNALDQPAALLGQACLEEGEAKVTYGTCAGFWYTHGSRLPHPRSMDASVAWSISGVPTYAVVGETITGGAAIVWLREKFKIPWPDYHLADIALGADGEDDLVLVPALSGLGSPHWVPEARGALYGLSAGVGLEHLVKAALQAIAFGVLDLLYAFENLEGLSRPDIIKADGGMTGNGYLMQFQADLLGFPVLVPRNAEGTSCGVAYLAGLSAGFYDGPGVLREAWETRRVYEPRMSLKDREALYARWQRAVQHTIALYQEPD